MLALLLASFTSLTLGACQAGKSFRAGEQAERAGRYDEAVAYYMRALTEDPSNERYKESLERAKLRASEDHALAASRLRDAGDLVAARQELELAVSLNPTNRKLSQELEAVDRAIEAGERQTRASIESLKERARQTRLGGLALGPGADEPTDLIFRDAGLRDVLVSLGKVAGVNVVFDADFADRPISIELEDTTFEEALGAICRVSQNFYQVQPGNVVAIIPDTPAKRREYEQQITKTFYLSTADPKETIDLLRIVLGARRVAPLTAASAITIVDSPERVAAAERIIETVDRGIGEVVVELELLEVNRAQMEEYGIQIRSSGTESVRSGIFPEDGTLDQSFYADANLLVTGLPGALVNLLRTDSDTRVLANPRLRALDGQTASVEFGERIPIPITTFTPIAQGGIAQQPITTFEYQNIGVTLEITPRVHHDDEVSLELLVQLDNISGSTLQGLPTFGNRRVSTRLRLSDGETSVLAGLIREEDRTSLTGLPGLASIPVLRRIFASNKKEVQTSDIVLTLTPRIVRRADLTLEELRSYVIEGGLGTGFLYEPTTPLPRREPEPPQPPEPDSERPNPQREP